MAKIDKAYLDVEQSLVPSNWARDARVFKLIRPDCDMLDTGKPTCSVILFSLSTDYKQSKQLIQTVSCTSTPAVSSLKLWKP